MQNNACRLSLHDLHSVFPQQFDEDLSPREAISASAFCARLNAWAQGFEGEDGQLPANVVIARDRIDACRFERDAKLDLSELCLPTLPDVIGSMTHLQSLKACGNRLEKFPAWLGALSELRQLDLSRNMIRSKSHDLLIGDKIEKVALHDNLQLAHFPKVLIGLMRAQDVEVSCHNTAIHPGEQVATVRWISGDHPSPEPVTARCITPLSRSRSAPIGIPGRSASHERLSPSKTESLFKAGHEVMSSSVQEKLNALQRNQNSAERFDPSLMRRRNLNQI